MHPKLYPFLDEQLFLSAVSRSLIALGQQCQEQILSSAGADALSLSDGSSTTEHSELEGQATLLSVLQPGWARDLQAAKGCV